MRARRLNLIATHESGAATPITRLNEEQGIAVVLVLIALSLITAFAAYLAVTGVEELRISDNSESMIQARYAARAGLEHAREVMRGINFDDALKGPDGTYSTDSTYWTTARTFGFRNLASWATMRSISLTSPTITGLADDGLVNTGKVGTTPGTVLIPLTGTALTVANPYGSGTITTARYFVKITDNNGEATEIAKDALNNPFHDGDGTVIVRSMGVAQSLQEGSGTSLRKNAVAVFESRLQIKGAFGNLGSPAIVIGSQMDATFNGNAFKIIGDGSGPGIGTIDTNLNDSYHPDQILRDATRNKGTITGNCSPNNNCVADITNNVINDPLRANLRDPVWLYDFVFNQVPTFADNIWDGRTTVDLGTRTNPKTTYVNGNLSVTGGITGAGLLVVTGDLDMGGSVVWDGLVLVIGSGSFWAHGMNRGIYGGVVVANLTLVGGVPTFGNSTIFDISGNSDIATHDGSLMNMGNSLIPLKQIAFREVISKLDP
jgi:hypothetical protein